MMPLPHLPSFNTDAMSTVMACITSLMVALMTFMLLPCILSGRVRMAINDISFSVTMTTYSRMEVSVPEMREGRTVIVRPRVSEHGHPPRNPSPTRPRRSIVESSFHLRHE